MSLNATLGYVKGLLDGLAIPGQTDTLVAFIAPPPVDDDPAAPPTVYVWAADGTEKRLAVPRADPTAGNPGGEKTANHAVTLWVTWPNAIDAADADTGFPAVLDAIMATLRTSPDPAQVTDPLTGAQSELVDVGENMTWMYAPPHALADQRWVRYDAEIRVPILEVFQS